MTSGNELAIATSGLTKRFGRHVAVDAIDLAVPIGSVYGFLGPNGSGKTTTMRMLVGLITPTEGTAELLGRRVPDDLLGALAHTGVLIEGPAFQPHLSGRANLARLDAADRTVARAGRLERIDQALERVGMTAAADRRYRAYSLGMRQRLGLAAALLRPRRLLVLDEPTNGLDPQGTREVRRVIAEVAAEGTTVFISSHLLAEVDQICTHVGVLRTGRLVAQSTLAEIRGQVMPTVRVETTQPGDAVDVARKLGHDVTATTATSVRIAAAEDANMEDLVVALVGAGVPVRELVAERPSLEDLFVSLTGTGFDVDE